MNTKIKRTRFTHCRRSDGVSPCILLYLNPLVLILKISVRADACKIIWNLRKKKNLNNNYVVAYTITQYPRRIRSCFKSMSEDKILKCAASNNFFFNVKNKLYQSEYCLLQWIMDKHPNIPPIVLEHLTYQNVC